MIEIFKAYFTEISQKTRLCVFTDERLGGGKIFLLFVATQIETYST
jgi:hypothetical protein